MEGSDTLLECKYDTDLSIFAVTWMKDRKTVLINSYDKGSDDLAQNYKGRIQNLQLDNIQNGHSILLLKTKLDDKGNYSCAMSGRFKHEQIIIYSPDIQVNVQGMSHLFTIQNHSLSMFV